MRLPGSWTIARPFGVPVRIHWSVPVCALLATRLDYHRPGAFVAFLLLVLIHEAGHAFVVRRVGARALALDVTGFGGLCWWEGSVTPIQRACIAWGGVWAQMVVLAATAIAVFVFGEPHHPFAADMVDVAIWSNLWLIGINLLPIPPLDGKEAWSLFPLLRRRFAARRARASERVLVAPRPAARVAPVRILPVRLDRAQIAKPSRGGADDEIRDEDDLTPEAREVLERVRGIVARAAVRTTPERGDPASSRDAKGSDKGRDTP